MTQQRLGRQGLRALTLLAATWRADLGAQYEYRFAWLVGSFVSTCWLLASITPALLVTRYGGIAEGWGLSDLLYVQAVWVLLDAFIWSVLTANIWRWPDLVRTGAMDHVLLRPCSSLLTASLSRLHVPDLPKFVLSAVLALWALTESLNPPSALELATFLACLASALVIIWALAVLLNCGALTLVQFDGWDIVFATQNLARVPTPAYGPVLQLLLTAVVPIGFLTTVPVQVLTGAAQPWLPLASIGIAVIMAVAARRMWYHQVQRYNGAMS